MFKLDMDAIRKTARTRLLTAKAANPANSQEKNPDFTGELAAIAKLAVSKRGPLFSESPAFPDQIFQAEVVVSDTAACKEFSAPPEARRIESQLYSKLQPATSVPEAPQAKNQVQPIVAWSALDRAYQLHHVKCPYCIAAGRGASYGLRCGTGMALWTNYQES